MRRLAAAAACAVAALPATPAAAEQVLPPPYVATYGSLYLPGDITIVQGSTLTLVNLETIGHDIVSTDWENGMPLYQSKIVYGPQTADLTRAEPMTFVDRVELLAEGTWPFTCSLHVEMRGTIKVTPLPAGGTA